MSRAPQQTVDPLRWCVAMALAFWALALWNLSLPSTLYFDEVHYIPAARDLLALSEYGNREHPLLGKQLMALGILLLGDNAWGWRIISTIAGVLTLFAVMRSVWFGTLDRFATLAAGILVATGFHLFVHARIAMLDVFMVCFCALACWQFAGAIREPETGRRRLILTGIALGLAMGAKWNAVVLAPLPGLVFLVARWFAGRRRLLLSRRGIPVPGITLLEAFLWLGIVPVLVYWTSFWPGYLFAKNPIDAGILAHHRDMLDLQTQVLAPHTYQSVWQDWIVNRRSIWYLWEEVDGAWRGVMLIGNPFTMLAGLPALAWCAWQGLVQRKAVHGAAALLYVVTLGFWMFAAKPTQFAFHYFLPSMALLTALALVLADLRKSGMAWLSHGVLAASIGVFVYFYPVLSAQALGHSHAFMAWTWLTSWV